MKRTKRPDSDHVCSFDEGGSRIALVGGSRPYLWVGSVKSNGPGTVHTFGGYGQNWRSNMRKLAKAILNATEEGHDGA